mgnify:CR=1 FL=1
MNSAAFVFTSNIYLHFFTWCGEVQRTLFDFGYKVRGFKHLAVKGCEKRLFRNNLYRNIRLAATAAQIGRESSSVGPAQPR